MKIPLIYNVRSVLQRPVSTALHRARHRAGRGRVHRHARAGERLPRRARAHRLQRERAAAAARRRQRAVERHGPARRSASSRPSPHIATGGDGRPLVSPEAYVVIPLPRKGHDTTGSPTSWCAASATRPLDGPPQHPGHGGPAAGVGQDRDLRRREAGGALRPHRRSATRCASPDATGTSSCRFTADGSAFESEIWGENEQFRPVFRGEAFQSVAFRLKDPAAFDEAKRAARGRQADHGGRRIASPTSTRSSRSCWATSSGSWRS